jgi:DNA polymerase III delta prime subunit
MDDLLLSHTTEQTVNSFIFNPGSGLLLIGSAGSGKTTILRYIAARLLDLDESQINSYPYIMQLMPNEKNSLGIDQIRAINRFISLAIPRNDVQQIKRLILIDDADKLTLEAQNAVLKNLEEPPYNTVFLLSCTNPNALLATLRSRVTQIRIANPNRDALMSHLERLSPNKQAIERAVGISGGSIGKTIGIIEQDETHTLAIAAKVAKNVLSASLYERLLMVNDLAKDPKLVNDLVTILQQMADISLEKAVGAQATRWKSILNVAYKTRQYLEHRTNMRLTLTYLMLNL